ncbi:RNA methyltransferase (TrmH family, group 1) [Rubidibacter lacunae KORDI 51-2]|uniref:tRNA (cytidine/uridine-2'-O-)-methyltransferase TrmJ n=1 Tax=Rubidibacter lacunae KORDI 51-2 TaxID=582515 RepID=U5DDF1_9CHRO|nr:RNA methyltransferase [Rubidibacter lacunae]ERN42538.1 RNA methyltransferase (TrmH family, group 1) [Rubidibacter lacunae KORDI 51-2]
MSLSKVRIVLVEPAGARNVGAIARAMKNFGLQHLAIVEPRCDPLGDEARQMAVHAADVLEAARCVPDLPAALEGCQRAIATTARARTAAIALEPPESALPWLLDPAIAAAALVFGPEDRGLSNAELNYAQRCVGIPTNPDYPSLNLATAVALCAYELARSARATAAGDVHLPAPSLPTPLPTEPPADLATLEGYYQHLEAVLLQIGFLYPHTAAARLEKFRRLYARAQPTAEEVALLRGVLRQTAWAIAQAARQSSDDRSSD